MASGEPPLDCGQAVAAAGTCPRCRLSDRPLWEPIEDLVACASCITRLYPGRDITFLAGERTTTARQAVLPGLATERTRP